MWPGVTALQDWNDDFPVWPSLQIGRFVSNINSDGIDLIEVSYGFKVSHTELK